jgi:hypothetical protein
VPCLAYATSTRTDPGSGLAGDASALLDELRHIRAMLERLLELHPGDAAPENGDDRPTLQYANGEPLSDNPAEHKAFRAHVAAEHTAPASVDALRAWVKAIPKT